MIRTPRPTGYVASNERFNEREFNEKGYTLIDNFLPNDIYAKIRGVLTGSGKHSYAQAEIAADPYLEHFPWNFTPGVVGKEITGGKPEEEHIYFTSLLFFSTPLSKWCPLIMGPILERTPNLRALQRCKANLYPRDSQFFEHAPHHDNTWEDAKGMLFMVNTCNGFTRLHDGTKFDSVGNRMLFFRPHLDHNSTNTTNAHCRVTINFNYF
ncbi:MAG: hypothetical protein HKN15_12805 [Xanthomonadales bacterium]|nr:hypothetical protein [Xanthomonadales bacterium]